MRRGGKTAVLRVAKKKKKQKIKTREKYFLKHAQQVAVTFRIEEWSRVLVI